MYYFNNGHYQNRLIFQLLRDALSLCSPNYVKNTAWKSKDLSWRETKSPNTTLAPGITYIFL